MRRLGTLLAVAALIAGCRKQAPLPTATAAPSSPIRFRDVTTEVGLKAPAEKDDLSALTIVQMSTGGGGFLDYDGDGRLDILVVGRSGCTLYHQETDGRFTDATQAAGLQLQGRWMGCATGDFDGDGRTDLVLTGEHSLALLHNEGGRFVDVTQQSGLAADRWYSSAAFADVDNDGRLDLYLGGYVDYGPDKPQHCPVGVDAAGKAVMGPCGPEPYTAKSGKLYLNLGGGKFRDATHEAGLDKATGKTLGVAFGDYDGDGRVDLYLANDRMPGDLFHNETKGAGIPRFRNVGVETGTAYNREGGVQGGMGVTWGDVNNDGKLDLFVATYQNEPKSLYLNEGGGMFREAGGLSGLAAASPYVSFGAGFLDADNDGWLDLFIANGHVLGPVEQVDHRLTYAQPMQLFRNRGNGSFDDISPAAGPVFAQKVVGRAAAFGDYDNDGRTDVLAIDVQGRPILLHNDSTTRNHWLRVRVTGPREVGARVTLKAEGKEQVREVTSGYSYLSANDPRVSFGLGSAAEAESVTVRWTDGKTTTVKAPKVDQELVVRREANR